MVPRTSKFFKLYYENMFLLLLGAFIIRPVLGSICMWILVHLGSIFRGLGRLGSVLGRLGGILGRLGGVLGAFRWCWAVPERSRVVARSSGAGISKFSLVFGGVGGGEATRGAWRPGGVADPLNQVF